MAKVQREEFSLALTNTTQTVYVMDITNYSGIAVTMRCPAGAAGTLFLEWCGTASPNDSDWSPVPVAQYPNASVALAANKAVVVNAHGIHVGQIRVRATLTAGAGNYDFWITAKDF